MEGYNKSREPLSVREEFRWERFGLHYDSHINFLRSEWQSKPKSLFFLAYRCLLCAFFGIGVVTYTVKFFRRGHCFIYLTNWSFYMCAITSAYAAILQTVYHCQKKSWVSPSWMIKVYWTCFWITLCIECLVALSYWTLIYPRDRVRTNPLYVSGLYNIWTHALAPIVFTVDHFVVAQPARLLHFVYPVGFCLIYFGFTIIFYLAGGVNLNGHIFIPQILKACKSCSICNSAGVFTGCLFYISVFLYFSVSVQNTLGAQALKTYIIPVN